MHKRNEDHAGCVAEPDATDVVARCECGGWRVLETLGEWAAKSSPSELARVLEGAEDRAAYWMAAADRNHELAETRGAQRDEWQREAQASARYWEEKYKVTRGVLEEERAASPELLARAQVEIDRLAAARAAREVAS